jgi:hypothetical protein
VKLYRIIFGTDGAPKWMKKHILQIEGCELADEFAMMLQRALNAGEKDLEFTSCLLGSKTNCSTDELSGNICRFLRGSPNAEQEKISSTNSRVKIRHSSFKTVSVAASSDDLKALRLRLEREEELLRMKQQENEHRMRIFELQLRVREVEDDISQSEKVKNWMHNDSDSICEDVRSQKSGAVGERRQQERVPEMPRSVVNVELRA